MYTPTFDELAGREDHFFSTYFGKAPLYRPGALKKDPTQILSIADLDAILHSEAIRRPYVRIMDNGEMVSHAAFTTTTRVQGANVTDTVVPEKVYELLRTGATITWAAINHFRPNLRALARMLATKFAAESSVTAFLTPAGRQGTNPQHNYFDVLVIQLEGASGWTLWNLPAVRRGDIKHYRAAELGEPVMEVTLQPGDVLYMPCGTPHVAVAGDKISLHLSVMVRAWMWRDLLRLTVDRLLEDEAFWQVPYLNDSTAGVQADALAGRAALLASRLREIDAAGDVRRLIALGQQSPGSSQGDTFQAMAATDADRFPGAGLPGVGFPAAGAGQPGAGQQGSASAAQGLTRDSIPSAVAR